MSKVVSRTNLMAAVGVVVVSAAAVLTLQSRGEGGDERAAEERRIASCLRRHGGEVDEDDVTVEDDGAISLPAGEGEPAGDELRTAMDECAAEPGWEPPRPTEAELERSLEEARAYVECLRPHGIELPDPVVIDGQVYFGDEQQTELTSLDVDDPQVVSALAACDPNA